MKFLVRLLKEENNVREDDNRDQLDFAPSVIEIGHALEHEPPVAGEEVRLFELFVLVGGGRFGVDLVVHFNQPQLALLFGHLGVDSNQNVLAGSIEIN